MLAPYPSEKMVAWPVSTRVGNVKNNDPSLIEPASGCPPSKPSGKIPDTHSVGSICDHDFGVFTVANIAMENTEAVPPAHPVPRMPKAANQGLQRCRGPSVPLTCLAPLAAWQSLCTGLLTPTGKFRRTGLHRRGPPEPGSRYFRQPCV